MKESRKKIFSKITFLIINIIIMIIVLIQWIKIINAGIYVVDLKFLCSLLIIIYVIGAFEWVTTTNRVFSPFFIFYFSCFLFNGGQILLYIFDIEINNFFVIFDNYNKILIAKMLIFQSFCVIAMISGALVAFNNKISDIFDNTQVYRSIKVYKKITIIDFLYICSTLAVVLSYFAKVLMRSQLDYTSYYNSYTSVSWMSSLEYLFYITMFYELWKYPSGKKNKIIIYIDILIAVLMILVGSRYNVVPIFAGILFFKFYINKEKYKMSKWKTISLIIIFVLAFSTMRGITLLRMYSLDSLSIDKIGEIYQKGISDGLADTLSETGASARCLLTTINYVDSSNTKKEYSIPYAITLGIVPMKVMNYFGFTPKFISLSAWITQVSKSKDGLGFSIFAESYYNFGMFGFAFLFLISFIIVKLEGRAIFLMSSKEYMKRLIACSYIYILVYISFLARADMILISSDIRRIIYIYILYLLLKTRKKEKSKSRL